MSDTKLLPCPNPWCRPNNTRIIKMRQSSDAGPGIWIRCRCGVCGPIESTRSNAIAAWNTRVDPVKDELVEALKATGGTK